MCFFLVKHSSKHFVNVYDALTIVAIFDKGLLMIFVLRVFITLSSHSCVYIHNICMQQWYIIATYRNNIFNRTTRYGCDATDCIYGTRCRVQPPAIYDRVKSNNNKYFGVKYTAIVHSLWTLPASLTCLSDKIIVLFDVTQKIFLLCIVSSLLLLLV